MATERIRVLSAIPGSTSIGPIVSDFCRKGEGAITSFSDGLLPVLQELVEDEPDFQVEPFGQVVSQFLTLAGEEVRKLATSGYQLAAVSHACRQVLDDSPFWSTRLKSGLHESLGKTLKELHDWGIDADEMDRLSQEASGRLSAKLRSLAGISREVTRILDTLGRQTHDQHLRMALESFPEWDEGRRRLLVFAGSDLHPLRLRWLTWLAEQGTEITVVFDRHATDGHLFRGARESLVSLGCAAEPVGEGNRLLKNLFSDSAHDGPGVEVTVTSAADPFAEAEWALRACLEAPERCGIYVRDVDAYAPLLEAAARRLDVPLRISRRTPLLSNSFARMVLGTLEFCSSSDVRSLSPLLHSSYLGLTGEEQSAILSGLKAAHGSRGLQWEELRTWSTGNGEQFPWLLKILEWRFEAMALTAGLGAWHGRLRELIDLLLEQALQSVPGYNVQRDTRASSVLLMALANEASIEMATQAGAPLSLSQFVARCRSLWSTADVSVPAAETGVCVASQGAALTDVDTLCVLGMLEGVFPRRRSEDPILTDAERQEISALRPGQLRLQVSEDIAAGERDEFYRVCAAARKRLIFSYPQTDDQRDNVPAFYLQMVEDAAGEVARIDHPRPVLAPNLDDCLSAADRRLREALDGPREGVAATELLTVEAKAALAPIPEASYRPQELRDALQCSFQFVARHRLRLRVRRRLARWSSLRKLPQIVALPSLGSVAEAEAALLQALEAELDTLYSEVPEWEMQLLSAGGRRLIRDWVRREARARQIWPKEEGSVRPHVRFGQEGLRDAMPGHVRIDGEVPAVSRMDRTSVMHLYGSGVKENADLTDVEKLFYGLHFLALHQPGQEAALEIEGTSGRRALLILSRSGLPRLTSHVQDGLYVVDLSQADDPWLSKKLFFDEVKRGLATAMDRIAKAKVDPQKGDHCQWCDYGELCRRSKDFGEEDSPFGWDTVLEDG